MNAFTSPTELIAASLTANKASPAASAAVQQLQRAPSDVAAGGVGAAERAVFTFSGVEMAVPFAITVVSEATSDPAGAEAAAKRVAKDVFDTALQHLSQFNPQSEISLKVNAKEALSGAAWVPISSVLGSVLRAAETAAAGTNNVFAPVVDAADGTRSLAFAEHFELEQDNRAACQFRMRRKSAAAVLDVCGIAKGWVVDTITTRLLAAGFNGVLVDWGGDIKAVGTTPKPDQAEWVVGVRTPSSSSGAASCSLNLSDAACATSGNFMQARPHIRLGVASAGMVPGDVVASVTVVHPSAATADALATYIFCAVAGSVVASTSPDGSSPEARLDAVCRGIVGRCGAFGFEMTHVVLQLYDGPSGAGGGGATRFVHWRRDDAAGSSAAAFAVPEVRLPAPGAPAANGAEGALAQLRRTMRRGVAVVFARIAGQGNDYFGATLSSGGLVSLLATQPTLAETPAGKLFSGSTLPKALESAAFLFSVMRNSRLFHLLLLRLGGGGGSASATASDDAAGWPPLWILLPRVNTAGAAADTADAQFHSLVARLNAFAGGAVITGEELSQLVSDQTTGSIVAPCSVFPVGNAATAAALPVNAGTHAVFALRVHIEKLVSSSSSPPGGKAEEMRKLLAAALPVLRVGRGYALATAPTGAQRALPQLYPCAPTSCAVATRMVKGQFFGCAVQHVEFVSFATDPERPVLQMVVPVHALSLAAFENFNLKVEGTGSGGPCVKLHFFSDHDDASSLLSWFADPSFMSGPRTEHFLYLPSAATPDEELAYQFPGTPGRAAALHTVVCDIIHVANLTLMQGGAGAPACLLLAQARRGTAKSFSSTSTRPQETQPTLAWM